jgi:FdrA protein
VSHGIGVGGRDLSEQVGGRMTLAALELLAKDPATKRIIVISKPPAASVTKKVLAKAKSLKKPVTLCLLGASGKQFKTTLEEAAGFKSKQQRKAKAKGAIRGLFCGGTLCAEAEIILAQEGVPARAYSLIDLGDDEYTQGRPHPMIEPALRNEHIAKALRDPKVGVLLLDVVIGYGAHPDPAGLIVEALRQAKSKKLVIASVTGTEDDPQVYSKQVRKLERTGVIVAESNAAAARIAARAVARR